MLFISKYLRHINDEYVIATDVFRRLLTLFFFNLVETDLEREVARYGSFCNKLVSKLVMKDLITQ